MGEGDTGEVTRLLLSWSHGDKAALDELIPFVYDELRRLASAYLRRERPDHTLRTNALVHEAYLRLVDQTRVDVPTRSQFFAIAARLMRQILVNHAERHHTAKRGGGNKVALVEDLALVPQTEIDLVELDQALTKLEHFDPRQGRIVELRFFGGLTEDETAQMLSVSIRTVQREWRTARAALYRELRRDGLE